MTTPNPELMLAAANSAEPDYKWRIYDIAHLGKIVCIDLGQYERGRQFNPLGNEADAHALMLALMETENGGWTFEKLVKKYHTTGLWKGQTMSELDESFTQLLLICVGSITNIPLEAP
jgi:hypothetical protein